MQNYGDCTTGRRCLTTPPRPGGAASTPGCSAAWTGCKRKTWNARVGVFCLRVHTRAAVPLAVHSRIFSSGGDYSCFCAHISHTPLLLFSPPLGVPKTLVSPVELLQGGVELKRLCLLCRRSVVFVVLKIQDESRLASCGVGGLLPRLIRAR